ncbi:MAG: hypothetical protein QXW75_00570 [Thermoplasmatales archaeon]
MTLKLIFFGDKLSWMPEPLMRSKLHIGKSTIVEYREATRRKIVVEIHDNEEGKHLFNKYSSRDVMADQIIQSLHNILELPDNFDIMVRVV